MDPIPPPENDDAVLLQWLADRDAPCPWCGYNLRALGSARCPECGERLRLSVSAVDPRIAAWTVLLVCCSTGAGIGLLFLVMLIRTGDWSDLSKAQFGAILTFIAYIPTPYFVARIRRPFQKRLGTSAQWAIAVASGVLVAIAIATFAASAS